MGNVWISIFSYLTYSKHGSVVCLHAALFTANYNCCLQPYDTTWMSSPQAGKCSLGGGWLAAVAMWLFPNYDNMMETQSTIKRICCRLWLLPPHPLLFRPFNNGLPYYSKYTVIFWEELQYHIIVTDVLSGLIIQYVIKTHCSIQYIETLIKTTSPCKWNLEQFML